MPLESKVRLSEKENHLYVKIGVEPRFKVNQNSEYLFVECGDHELSLEPNFTREPRNFVFASNFGIGYEIKFTEKLKLILEPEVGYTWTKIYNTSGPIGDENNDISVASWGLKVGVIR